MKFPKVSSFLLEAAIDKASATAKALSNDPALKERLLNSFFVPSTRQAGHFLLPDSTTFIFTKAPIGSPEIAYRNMYAYFQLFRTLLPLAQKSTSIANTPLVKSIVASKVFGIHFTIRPDAPKERESVSLLYTLQTENHLNIDLDQITLTQQEMPVIDYTKLPKLKEYGEYYVHPSTKSIYFANKPVNKFQGAFGKLARGAFPQHDLFFYADKSKLPETVNLETQKDGYAAMF